jgi:hypothetical protein
VRLIADAFADADLVLAGGNAFRIGLGRKQAAPRVVVLWPRNVHRGGGNELVRALQVVVLERRLVNLLDHVVLIGRVRLRRIEMLGTIGERAVENVAAAVLRRIGIVPDPPASGETASEQDRRIQSAAHGGQV